MERHILEPLLSRPAVVDHLKGKGRFVWIGEGLTLSFVDEEDSNSSSSGRSRYDGYDSDEQSVWLEKKEETFVQTLVQSLSTNRYNGISVDDLNTKYPCLLADFLAAVNAEGGALMDRDKLTVFLENKWVKEYVVYWYGGAFEWEWDDEEEVDNTSVKV